ncbi:MAG: DNA mismatch repair endonuclease MutL [Clostridia bacterium]|nr:DNA mismatch repair endonuclease MutL [Clostridia bacterium]
MGKINVLPFAVANLIAAGEVVDRPASVIKELMENAIDAGATNVTVEIRNGGVTFMRVSDNGCGISREDLPVALRRHATSKIKDQTDLQSIITLGFRGEALAAISAVSDVRIISKTAEAEFGSLLEAPCGGEVTVVEQGCSNGTTVIVENLFGKVPARRKFLKKDLTESMAVGANVEKVALSHPEIAFRLIVDGNVRLETAGDGDLLHTIHSVFGKEFAARMLAVKGGSDGITVTGYTGRSDNYKPNRNHENFFINGRYVKSKTIMAAVEQAYTSYMPPERFPCCVLFMEIDPSRVDVNVHPSKLEVKFSNEKAVFEAVYYAVRNVLESNVTRPNINIDSALKRNPFAFPGGKVSQATAPVENSRPESLGSRQLSYDLGGRTQHQPQERMTSEEYRRTAEAGNRPVPPQKPSKLPNGAVEVPLHVDVKFPPSVSPDAPLIAADAHTADRVDVPRAEAPAAREASAPPTEPEPTPSPQTDAPSLPEYRIVGSAFNCYVIVETGDKLLLIDQHAAHERILFEKLKAGLYQTPVASQMLMLPVDTMLTAAEVDVLKDYDDELHKIGFALRYARNTVSADAIPEGVDTSDVGSMLSTMAGRLIDNTGSVKLTRDILFEKALYQAACKAAIKGGREYAPEHIEWLVKKLMELPDITFCPHGRPVALELTKRKLDQQFDRTGF